MSGEWAETEVAAQIAEGSAGRKVLFLVCYFLEGAQEVLKALGEDRSGVATDDSPF